MLENVTPISEVHSLLLVSKELGLDEEQLIFFFFNDYCPWYTQTTQPDQPDTLEEDGRQPE